MVAYLNGRLPTSALINISGALLTPTTAQAFTRMDAACRKATGMGLDIVNGTGGYRTWDVQQEMWEQRAAYAAQGITIASPGNSTHGLGTALDLTTSCWTPTVAAWVRAHRATYGFVTPPANDPRHFLHNGTTTGPASTTSTPINEPAPVPEKKDTEMFLVQSPAPDGTVYLVGELSTVPIGPGILPFYIDRFGPYTPVNTAQWYQIQDDRRIARTQLPVTPAGTTTGTPAEPVNLTDPTFLAAVAGAVNDEAAARLAN